MRCLAVLWFTFPQMVQGDCKVADFKTTYYTYVYAIKSADLFGKLHDVANELLSV